MNQFILLIIFFKEKILSAIYKAVVIGGGAAGLLCLNELLSGKDSLDSRRVLLLEKNDRVGKKLASTGNGRGNLFNSSMTESCNT